MQLIDKLAWIEIKDNAILLTKSLGKDKFYIPGGKRELNETDEQALIREIYEELNVTVDKHTMKYIGTFEAQAHAQPEGIFVKMTCYTGEYQGEISVSSEIEALQWFTYADKDKVVNVDKLIFEHLKQNDLLT